jgi:hypothetical protein
MKIVQYVTEQTCTEVREDAPPLLERLSQKEPIVSFFGGVGVPAIKLARKNEDVREGGFLISLRV